MEQEQERGITIQSAATTCFWNDHRFNIIDTPGHVDFTVEVYRSLKFSMVVSVYSVALEASSLNQKPIGAREWFRGCRIIFVNKLDRMGADFYRVVDRVKRVLGANPLVMTLPIGREDDFSGVVDVLTKKAYIWDESGQPENYEITDVPADMVDDVEMYHEQLIETAVEEDDDLIWPTWRVRKYPLKT